MNASRLLVLGGLAAFLPLTTADAQPRRGQLRPRMIAPRDPSASELLDRRRELELTPRQVARLDSIERVDFANRRAIRERMTQQRDSLCATRRPCVLTPEERDRFRAQFEQNRPQREQMMQSDSLSRSRANALLDSTQRGRLQTMRERRVMRERAGLMRDRMDGRRGLRGMEFRRDGMRGFERGRMQRERQMRGFERRERRMFRDDAPRRLPREERPDSSSR